MKKIDRLLMTIGILIACVLNPIIIKAEETPPTLGNTKLEFKDNTLYTDGTASGKVTQEYNEKNNAQKFTDGLVKTTVDSANSFFTQIYTYKNNTPILDSLKIFDAQGQTPNGLYYKNSKLNGIWKTYRKNNSLRGEYLIENGIYKELKTYNDYGKIELIITYDYVAKIMLSKVFYSNGNLKQEAKAAINETGEFIKNIYSKKYDESGKIISEINSDK